MQEMQQRWWCWSAPIISGVVVVVWYCHLEDKVWTSDVVQVAKATKHEQHVACCVVRVLLPPYGSTVEALTAAAAGQGGSRSTGKPSARCSSSSIRSFFKPQPKVPGATAAGVEQQQQQQQQQQVLSEADLLAAGIVMNYLLVQAAVTRGCWLGCGSSPRWARHCQVVTVTDIGINIHVSFLIWVIALHYACAVWVKKSIMIGDTRDDGGCNEHLPCL